MTGRVAPELALAPRDFAAWCESGLRALGGQSPRRIEDEDVPAGFRHASVLALFWPESPSEVRTVLTVRTAHLPSHRGEISFPGGGRQAGDADAVDTALRETEEELGVPPRSVDVVAQLDDTWSIGRFIVSPFVAWTPERPSFVPDPGEIDRVICADVGRLLAPGVHRSVEMGTAPLAFTMHEYHYEGDRIWGLTGGILHHLLQRVAGLPATPMRHVELLRRFAAREG